MKPLRRRNSIRTQVPESILARADGGGRLFTPKGIVFAPLQPAEAEIKKRGGEFFTQLPNYPGVDAEKKFKDINGIVFDVAEHGWGPTV